MVLATLRGSSPPGKIVAAWAREAYMPRPKGSPNKSPRELTAEGKRLIEQAKLKARVSKLEKKVAELQKKR